MQLRYNLRVYPTPGQQITLVQAFGWVCVVYNDAFATRMEAFDKGERLSDVELSRRLTASRSIPERACLGEVPAVLLQQALADLNTAYRNFFASVTGKRKGPRIGLRTSPPLHVREGTCGCRTTHDRDVNAALNILTAGQAGRLTDCGGAVSPSG